MKYIFIFLNFLVLSSCSKQDKLNPDIEIGFEYDTIYDYQPLRHYYKYSNILDLDLRGEVVEAVVNSSFGTFDILKNLNRDSISFKTFVFTSAEDFGIEEPSTYIGWAELKFSFSLKTKNGIDTTFKHQKRFYYDCSPDSPIAEGMLSANKRIGRWIFYETIKKERIRAISHYNKEGLRDNVDTIFHDYSKNKIAELTTWSNGLKNGSTKSFTETTGQVIKIGQYKDGLRNGKWINITYTGIINHIIQYEMGKELSRKEIYSKKVLYNEEEGSFH